ncbi:DUF6531 domain-containing protein [Micromonospora sp. SL1-18]|uniref:DUF6531 domain-containing protein n=1 Tax=Micromonospora sp. SL1-18 TaxID=3399128 RepID=UPI003A4D2EDA
MNTATGNYTQAAMDLSFSSRLLAWGRTYNSLITESGPLGRGWTTALSAHLVTGDSGAAFHDDDGRVLTFSSDGSGGYRRPQDLNADLTKAADGTFALRSLSGETWIFDASGRMSERKTEGQSVTFGYDSAGRLASAMHSAGLGLSLSYDADGRLTKAAATDGREVLYEYSADGALASVKRPGGAVTRYATTSDGLITEVLDADGGRVVKNSYDGAGRVSHQDLSGGVGTDFAYDDTAGVTTVTSTSTGTKLTYQHSPSGRLVKVTDPAGNSVNRTFDDNGRLVSVSNRGGTVTRLEYDARGNLVRRVWGTVTTTYAYDAQDRLTAVTDAAGQVTGRAYTGDSRVPSEVTHPDGAKARNTVVNGLVTESVDPTGVKTTYGYDGARRLTAVTDATGKTTRFGYDSAGRRTSVQLPSGTTTRYDYDAAGRITTTTTASGAVTRYRYSTAGRLLDTTDPSGAVTASTYDEVGRQASSTDPLDRKTTYTYDGEGNLATSTDPAGGVSRYAYDAQSRLSSVTDPTGIVVRYSYDADGRQTEVTEAAGTEATSYDAHGNVTTTVDATGHKTSYEYDALDRVVATTDAAGATTRTTYDPTGRVVAVTDALSAVTRYEYDAAGRQVAVIDPLGNTTRYEYDAAGRLIKKIMPTGGAYRYAYDEDGRLISQTTPAGLVTRYGYNADNQITSITDPRGGVTRYEYDSRGLRIKMTSPGGAVRRMEYDAARQMIAAIDPNGATTRYAYDVAGNLSSLTDAKGAVTKYTHDASGRETSVTDPLGRKTEQTFDAAGNLTAVTDPAGKTLRMEYDAAGRPTRRIGDDGAEVSYGYDGVGRRTSMSDANGTTSYAYDLVGRLLKVTHPDGSAFTSSYDAAGRRVGLRYPDGLAIDYQYNGDGALTGLSDPRAGDVAYTLDADGRLLTEALPKKWSRAYRYDGGLLASYQEYRAGAPAEDATLTRNADGRVTQLVDPTPGRKYQYTYDAAGQLLSANGQVGGTLRATYDAVGNRTSITRGNVQTSLSYDAADQLVAADTGSKHVAYSYDPSGRLVHRTGPNDELTVAYDSFGLPTTTTQSSGGVTQTSAATYDGDGLLTRMATTRQPVNAPPQTSTVSYQWSAGVGDPQVLAQRGDNAAAFVYGYGRVSADTSSGTATFARDTFGSTIQTADTAAWAQAGDYDVFGAPHSAGTPSVYNPAFGYRGELGYRGEQPAGSLLYLRARTYDAGVGRFTARDPITNFVGRTDTASPYSYANNDPVNLVDPSGKIPDPYDTPGYGFIGGDGLGPDPGVPDLECVPPGGSLESHPKLFQGKGPLCTRGSIPESCLNAEEICLNKLWWAHQPERAAQAFTIHELNYQREGWFESWWHSTSGGATTISDDVDWEVGDKNSDYEIGFNGFAIDIVTEESKMFEVKRWVGNSTVAVVTAQLLRYQLTVKRWFDIDFTPSTELAKWASSFEVHEHWYSWGSRVYVWGLGNQPGHIYFAKDDKAPDRVRAKVDADNNWDTILGLVGIGIRTGGAPAPAPAAPRPILVP